MMIRGVQESELPQLLALIQASAEFDGCLESVVATAESLRTALFSTRPLAHALVAEVEGRIVGMATYYANFSSFTAKPGLWLDDLFVYENCRGLGVGGALMKRLCAVAEAGGCGRVDWLVSNANERGKTFYRRIGATISEKAQLLRLGETQLVALAQSEAQR
jgi:GNAT superfamily N-acetyltransferase